MKRLQKHRGILLFSLIVVFAASGMGVGGTSFASEDLKQEPQVTEEHLAYAVGYPDGTIRPLEVMTREEAAVIFYRLMSEEQREAFIYTGQPFFDVGETRWSSREITALYHANILKGNPGGAFLPSKPISRAEFAAVAARFSRLEGKMAGINEAESKFPDTKGHWAEAAIDASTEEGWIRGYGDGNFRPDRTILRCEAMMLLNDALDRRVNAPGLLADAKQWPDNPAEKWYFEIVMEASNSHCCERADRPKSTEKWTKIEESPTW